MESILISIKKLLGISEDYTQFDPEIIIHINTVFLNLTQLGVGPINGFSIKDANDEWTDFIEDNIQLEAVKSYIYLKVKLLFDPPLSSAVIESTNRMISELEWRLNTAVEYNGVTKEEVKELTDRVDKIENTVNEHEEALNESTRNVCLA